MTRRSAAGWIRVVLIAIVAGLGLTLMSTPSSAVSVQSNPNVRYTTSLSSAAIHEMRASYSWQCMDVRGESQNLGAVVQRYDCTGRLNQRFYFIPLSGNTFQIRVYWQSYCVGAVYPGPNAPLTTNNCGNSGSVFRWMDMGSNHWEIVEVTSGLCIRDNGRRVQLTLTTCARPVQEPYPSLWTAIYKGQYNYGSVWG